ncbi:hypothetical protein AB0C29_25920 [Actinoplanes sp. NPDC048791]|uniref:hypothetical protein n=1 Tax=Actinoplanes sp. NPDC048791 TaxID=3154623 RepID=UPI0033E1D2C9
MGYTLEAFIGDPGVLRPVVDRWPVAALVPLSAGLSLIPMTDELFDAAGGGPTSEALGFWKLPAGFEPERVAGAVAYVEAEFFGGVGTQRAALWMSGRLALGPLFVGEDEHFAPAGSPISQVLARLGAGREGHHDEFDAIGLGRHRHTEDWLS